MAFARKMLFIASLAIAAFSYAMAAEAGSPLRWGFIGCGRITNDWAATIDSLPDLEHQAVAFASRNASRAEEYAKRFGGAKWYGSYEELAKDPDVDIVYIGTINPTHYEISKLLLANNKSVLCEKPMTLMKDQAAEIFQIAEQKKLFYQEAVLSRFFPVYHRMQDLVKTIGDIKLVTAVMGQNSAMSQRHVRKQLGGGALKDIGGYTLQFALFVLGNDMPDKIHAVSQLNNESIDATTAIQLQWKDGRIASLSVSVLVSVIPTDAYVYGLNATIKVPKSFNRPDMLEITRKDKDSENKTQEKYPLPKIINHKQLLKHGEGMVYQAQEVRRCIQAGLLESPYMSHKDTLTILAIEDEILKQIGVSYDALYKDGKFVGSDLRPENDPTYL